MSTRSQAFSLTVSLSSVSLLSVSLAMLACASSLTALALDAPAAGDAAARPAIQLEVDLRDAPKRRFLVHESVPVKSGKLELRYPKWIPGEHAPSGPLNGVTGITVSANGKVLPWRRDHSEMYEIELDIPTGVETIDLQFQYLPAGDGQFGGSGSTTPNLLELEWNQVLFYPAGMPVNAIPIVASARLPDGWEFATALDTTRTSRNAVSFASTSVEQLVDSPLFAARYLRRVDLAPDARQPVRLNLIGDRPDNLDMKPEQVAHARALVVQALKLTGTAHYRHYDFLFGLSDHTGSFGLEHHQSSDDRTVAEYYTDPDNYIADAILLPHEYFHSWNGKFRRPKGLATPDYQLPMRGGLLWVYEGMTNYYGEVLAARAGMWTAAQYRDSLAMTAAAMQYQRGRRWRPLQDTADAAQLLYGAPGAYSNWRRSVDYYPEGSLLWLDVDTRLRTLSDGRVSLDDFVRTFHGTHPDSIEVLPYDFDDVVHTLEGLVPYDWRGMLTGLLESRSDDAPLEGLKRSGWSLAFDPTPSPLFKASEKLRKEQVQRYDIGFDVSTDDAKGKGTILDVEWEGPAFAAGLVPGMHLVAVNDEEYSADGLRRAITQAVGSKAPIRLLVSDAGLFQSVSIDYHGGLRYPHLEAISGKPDLLGRIAAARP